jgi:A/G-specific adenine glycosylase
MISSYICKRPLTERRRTLPSSEPEDRGWQWNQALMETGALICTARKPSCDGCPLRDGCRARREVEAAGWPRPERKGRSDRYQDTNRFYRGRVLAELREDSRAGGGGIALRELGRRVKEEFDEGDAGWLHEAVESLCKDGLAEVWTLPEANGPAGMVAEERAPYGTVEPSPEARVSLP